jgi:TRAP transporter TAXI family solute receptor
VTTEHRPFRDHFRIYGPALLITLIGFVMAYQFVQPAPPGEIRIATGQPEGAYYLFSQRYQKLLAGENIRLEILNTSGSVDNLGLLRSGKADVAFIQGGTTEQVEADGLRSLGSLYYEPIWLFHRKELRVERLTDLRQKRIAIGSEGSGTRAVALQLLTDNAINDSNTSLLAEGGRAAADALLNGGIDAAFFVASPKSPVVRALLDAGNIQLMSFERADAYTRLHRYLSSVILPQGVINLGQNLPEKETRLLTASANLVIRDDLHPALMDLLLQAAEAVHGEGGWFEEAGEFPAARYLVFPLSKEAQRFYDYGPPLLQRYLPFWAATLVDRLKVMLLPLVALMIPLFKIMPPIYRWRIRSRIYRWYREVLSIDRRQHREAVEIDRSLSELNDITRDVANVSVPLSYAEELYDLRLHINLVKEHLERLRERRPATPDTGTEEPQGS